jgi:hypothetical protein
LRSLGGHTNDRNYRNGRNYRNPAVDRNGRNLRNRCDCECGELRIEASRQWGISFRDGMKHECEREHRT